MHDIAMTLRKVVRIADRIAVGDLAVDATFAARKDDIGVLARAFERMVATLKEMSGVAERIAAGDLSVEVKPRSDADVMGHAFANMVQRLSALMGAVQQSGIQVNSSVNEIASTARQQQTTASEIAATTVRDRRHVEGNLGHVQGAGQDDDGSLRGRRTHGDAGGQRAGRAHAHGRHDAPRHGRGRVDQREAGRAEREGRQHQLRS